jgi:hypothetical protein
MEEMFVQIRDVFYHARSQQEAYEQLSRFAKSITDKESFPWKGYHRAQSCVEQLIQAGRSADTLVVGYTDGHRSLCLLCSQDERNFQRVSFYLPERRLLLRPEIGDIRRASYTKCQCCREPINPQAFVLFTFGGTVRHTSPCHCNQCNRAGIAYLLQIYACEKEEQQVVFPCLQQVAAPSRKQCVERAITLCWEQGWYMLNKNLC